MKNTRWLCSVCGYLHLGESAPDCCPICGASPDYFEASAEALPAAAADAPGRWRCLNCDFIHEGSAPPEACPVCGVGPDQFEPLGLEESGPVARTMTGSIVIIGAGIAGISAAEAARDAAPRASITLISKEPVLPYYRLNLTRYLAGEIGAQDLPVHPESWYAERNITVWTCTEVTAIDRTARTVSLKGEPELRYDKLVLAMGAHPSVPTIAGVHRKRVVTLRTLRDAEKILEHCQADTRCVIIGGGVLGLETAAALARLRVQVTLVEGFDWLLPRQLNRAAGERLAQQARSLGITLLCGEKIKELDGDEQVRSVVLESGVVLPADTVIVTAGVRSNSFLARLAGLEVDGGVVVDQHLRTSDPDIHAAGDLAEHQGVFYGTWAPAQFQGTIAGRNAAGDQAVFVGVPRSNSLKVLGVDLFSIGLVHPDDASYRLIEEDGEHYDLFVFRDNRLMGAILLGDLAIAPALKKLIETRACCSDLLNNYTDAGGIRAGIAGAHPL
jgi:nitrite reductase (NADH) large subunit